MKVIILILFGVLTFSSNIFAATDQLNLKVYFGDRATKFEVQKSKKGALLTYQDSYGPHLQISLTEADYKSLMTKGGQIKNDQGDADQCQRAYLKAEFVFKGSKNTSVRCLAKLKSNDASKAILNDLEALVTK